MKVDFSVCGFCLASWIVGLGLWPAMLAGGVESGTDEVDAQTVVQIEVVRQMQDSSQRTVAYLSAQEEFVQFSRVLEDALRDEALDAAFVVRRFPGKFDPALPRITIYLHEWGSHRDGQVRAVIGVRSRWREHVIELGTFSGRASLPITPVRSLRDKGYHDAMRKACEGVAAKLKEHLLSGDEEWRIKDAERE